MDKTSETGFFEKSKRGRGRAKHAILDKYLKAWFPIMGYSHKKYGNGERLALVYVDGFAGTGSYTSPGDGIPDEPGSPIIAYRAAAYHQQLQSFCNNAFIQLIYVEKDAENARKLEKALQEAQEEAKLTILRVTDLVKFSVLCEEFADALENILENPLYNRSPMFVFADPFGYSGKMLPHKTLRKLLERVHGNGTGGRLPTELFVTVMDSFARRFISDARKSSCIIELMGHETNWLYLTVENDFTPDERRTQFIDLYTSNLTKDIQNAFSLKFSMRDKGNRHIYHLVFMTTHELGLMKMKAAMWPTTQNPNEMVFSEWVENKDSPPPIKDKQLIAIDVAEKLQVKYAEQDLTGFEIQRFILHKIPYHSNFVNELKRLLTAFQYNKGVKKFEDIQYHFPRTSDLPSQSQSVQTIETPVKASKRKAKVQTKAYEKPNAGLRKKVRKINAGVHISLSSTAKNQQKFENEK